MVQLRDTTVIGTLTASGAIKGSSVSGGNYRIVLKQDSIELYGNSSQTTPFIDFHHNGDIGDYTHRIIAQADKKLSILVNTVAFSGGISI